MLSRLLLCFSYLMSHLSPSLLALENTPPTHIEGHETEAYSTDDDFTDGSFTNENNQEIIAASRIDGLAFVLRDTENFKLFARALHKHLAAKQVSIVAIKGKKRRKEMQGLTKDLWEKFSPDLRSSDTGLFFSDDFIQEDVIKDALCVRMAKFDKPQSLDIQPLDANFRAILLEQDHFLSPAGIGPFFMGILDYKHHNPDIKLKPQSLESIHIIADFYDVEVFSSSIDGSMCFTSTTVQEPDKNTWWGRIFENETDFSQPVEGVTFGIYVEQFSITELIEDEYQRFQMASDGYFQGLHSHVKNIHSSMEKFNQQQQQEYEERQQEEIASAHSLWNLAAAFTRRVFNINLSPGTITHQRPRQLQKSDFNVNLYVSGDRDDSFINSLRIAQHLLRLQHYGYSTSHGYVKPYTDLISHQFSPVAIRLEQTHSHDFRCSLSNAKEVEDFGVILISASNLGFLLKEGDNKREIAEAKETMRLKMPHKKKDIIAVLVAEPETLFQEFSWENNAMIEQVENLCKRYHRDVLAELNVPICRLVELPIMMVHFDKDIYLEDIKSRLPRLDAMAKRNVRALQDMLEIVNLRIAKRTLTNSISSLRKS